MKIFAQDGFDVSVKIQGSEKFLSPRLNKHEEDIRSLNLLGVLLGNENQRASRSRSAPVDGNASFEECLKWQQKVAKSVVSSKSNSCPKGLYFYGDNCASKIAFES